VEADVILHVRDVAHEDTAAQAQDVGDVLRRLDVDPEDGARLIEVWNKIDVIPPERRLELANTAERRPAGHRPVLVSAVTGEGLGPPVGAIEGRGAAGAPRRRLKLGPEAGAANPRRP